MHKSVCFLKFQLKKSFKSTKLGLDKLHQSISLPKKLLKLQNYGNLTKYFLSLQLPENSQASKFLKNLCNLIYFGFTLKIFSCNTQQFPRKNLANLQIFLVYIILKNVAVTNASELNDSWQLETFMATLMLPGALRVNISA